MSYETEMARDMLTDAASYRREGFTIFAEAIERRALMEHKKFDADKGQLVALPLIQPQPTPLEKIAQEAEV